MSGRTTSRLQRTISRQLVPLAGLLASLCAPNLAEAKDFYVDPVKGAKTGDGSAAKPWRTIQEVIDAKQVETQSWDQLPHQPGSSKLVPRNVGAPIKAGDTIYLRSGFHGSLTISGHYNAKEILIAAAPGETPRLSWVRIVGSSRWRIRGLSISPSFAQTYQRKTMISIESPGYQGPSEDVVIEGNTLRSVPDISAWSANDWDTKATNGISVSGPRHQVLNNTLENVNFGIRVSGVDALVRGNTINRFSGDGLRGLGDRGLFENNLVKNCYEVNANHDDGFQSWSVKGGKVGAGEVRGVVLRGNTIINYDDPNQPMRCQLQGIGMFDGTFVDWVIENNVIIVDHWHGITLLGARNCRVVNNTVMDPNGAKPGPPWIKIGKHKKGTAPTDCLVRNNIAHDFTSASGVIADHNIKIKDASKLFVDPAGYDLHLLQSSAAVDQGSSAQAPATDIEGTPRPQGSAVDVGAYEWHETKLDAGLLDGAAQADGGIGPVADGGGVTPDHGAASGDGAVSVGDAGGGSSGGCVMTDAGRIGGVGLWLLLALLLGRRRRHSRR
ncbi:MAG: hypothetical protein CSB49_07280 [Proteobacteria bacterium]|nr:MAG: hypothetical protein CSB49_07280 [Pseudomonadota bacterium]